jgi:hypothetical protein
MSETIASANNACQDRLPPPPLPAGCDVDGPGVP